MTIARCGTCGESFPVFTFCADTDMLTVGCIALTAPGHRLALTMQRPNERLGEIEARVGRGYKVVGVRYVDSSPVAHGMSFQEFRKLYHPPEPVYRCISCSSDSSHERVETKEQFLTHGHIEVCE